MTTDEIQAKIDALPALPRTPLDRALECLISEFSEDYWAAGWLHGIERDLWIELTNPEARPFGKLKINPEFLATIKEIAKRSGRWVVWREGEGPGWGGVVPVDLKAWMAVMGAFEEFGEPVACGLCNTDLDRSGDGVDWDDAPSLMGGQTVAPWCRNCARAWRLGMDTAQEVERRRQEAQP